MARGPELGMNDNGTGGAHRGLLTGYDHAGDRNCVRLSPAGKPGSRGAGLLAATGTHLRALTVSRLRSAPSAPNRAGACGPADPCLLPGVRNASAARRRDMSREEALEGQAEPWPRSTTQPRWLAVPGQHGWRFTWRTLGQAVTRRRWLVPPRRRRALAVARAAVQLGLAMSVLTSRRVLPARRLRRRSPATATQPGGQGTGRSLQRRNRRQGAVCPRPSRCDLRAVRPARQYAAAGQLTGGIRPRIPAGMRHRGPRESRNEAILGDAPAPPVPAVPAVRKSGGGQLAHLPRDRGTVVRQPAPARLGPYRLLEPIGEGGMSVVYRAAGPDDQMVAVKILRRPAAASEEARCRLAREVQAMRRVRSPFVAEVTDADLVGDIPYLVTRLVQGRTLAQLIDDQGPLRGTALQRLAYGLADGLAAVHAAGVVHRDLKPGNVMMAAGDPVLIDFGIACQADSAPITQTGMFIGTPGHIAPEVIQGQRARPPADVHGWGTTVGYAARGEPVYGTGGYDVVFCRILRAEVSVDGIPAALCPLVAGALSRQPEQRPRAAWLAGEAARLNLEVPAAPPASGPPVLAKGGAVTLPVPTGCQAPVRQRIAYQRPEEVADLLPAVRYAPVRRTAHASRRKATAVRASRRPHPMLAFAALVMAVSTSFLLPLAGTVTVAALLTLLRAGSKVRRGLARRGAAGSRARDKLPLVLSIPWVLLKSIAETALLAPLLLTAAGVAVVAGTITARDSYMLPAWTALAATYTALSCIGPRSRPARRQLNRVLDAIASSPLAAATTLLTLSLLAVTIAGLAIAKTPPLWPLHGLHGMHVRLPGLNRASLHG